MKKILFIATIVLITGLAVYGVFHPVIYDSNYFAKVGLGRFGWFYQDVVDKHGEPISIENQNDRVLVNYDGLTFIFNNIERGIVQAVCINGKQYRFGIWRIGIGTPRTKIESVYRHIRKISGVPENEIGVIDGSTWIWYTFDENNNVSEITLTIGL